MIFYEIFIDFIEVFLMTYFISYYFDFENKNKYIIFNTFILFIISEISRVFNYYNLFFSLTFVFYLVFSVYIYTKKMNLEYIYISLLYFILLSINIVFWLVLKDYMTILNIRFYDLTFNKTLQLLETVLLLKFKDKLAITLDILRWKIILIYEFLLFVLSYFLINDIILENNISNLTLCLCAILLLILCIMFMYIVNLVNEENREKIKLVQEKQQIRFDKQKYYALSHVKDEIKDIEHRLFYVVFQIENYLKDKDYHKIEEIINYYKNDILNHQLVIDTKNHVFDVLYSIKINHFIKKGIDINNCIVITKNSFYDNLDFINLLNDVLDYFSDCKVIEINIAEEDGYVIIRIIRLEGFVNLDHIVRLLENHKDQLRLIYNYEKFDIKGLRMTFMMKTNDI